MAFRPIARHVTQRILNPHFLTHMASYGVASNICQAEAG
jgi:hypothetical protein